jgi:hypothetical protein
MIILYSTDRVEARQEAEALTLKKKLLHSKLILPLVKHSRKTNAFLIAEKYRDFEILCDLSVKDANKSSRLEDYLNRYSFDFAHVLYTMYMDQGLYSDLMNVEPQHQHYLETFLKQSNLPWLSWIEDVKTERFDEASRALETVANAEKDLKKQHVYIFVIFMIACLLFKQINVLCSNARFGFDG